MTFADDGLHGDLDLDEIILSFTSYPLIQISQSDPSHRLRNYLFVIHLKQKLHLEIFDPQVLSGLPLRQNN